MGWGDNYTKTSQPTFAPPPNERGDSNVVNRANEFLTQNQLTGGIKKELFTKPTAKGRKFMDSLSRADKNALTAHVSKMGSGND